MLVTKGCDAATYDRGVKAMSRGPSRRVMTISIEALGTVTDWPSELILASVDAQPMKSQTVAGSTDHVDQSETSDMKPRCYSL